MSSRPPLTHGNEHYCSYKQLFFPYNAQLVALKLLSKCMRINTNAARQ